jgi:Protein of unknown function (DUF1488)
MALNFEPEQIVYDLEESLIRFLATEGGAVIGCGISIAALAALEDRALGGADEAVTSFFRHRDLIQDIAERKYRARRFETGGRVVVRLQDLAA